MQQNLRERNANLRRTRDFLLPKLISGEIDVENMEIVMGDEAARTAVEDAAGQPGAGDYPQGASAMREARLAPMSSAQASAP
jgi:hypothetical protein